MFNYAQVELQHTSPGAPITWWERNDTLCSLTSPGHRLLGESW